MQKQFMNRGGAEYLAEKIRDYWAAHGHVVDVWLEDFYVARLDAEMYSVRSDMVNGLPRTWVGSTEELARPRWW